MNKRIVDLVKLSQKSKQPTLSAFITLQGEDHSFKKHRSLFVKASNELKRQGAKIEMLDKILSDNLVTGAELGLDTGLGDINVALYILENKIVAIPVDREFNDQYCLSRHPFIVPAVKRRMDGIKTLVINRRFARLYALENDRPTLMDASFPEFPEAELENFDNQIVKDRTKPRSHAIAKNYVKQILDKATKEFFKKDDQILIVASEDFMATARAIMEESKWRRSHVIEKLNLTRLGPKDVEAKILELLKKNKIGHYRPLSEGRGTRDFKSLNTLRKEAPIGNIKNLWISESVISAALANIQESRDLNQFLSEVALAGVHISSFENMADSYSVDLKEYSESTSYGGHF